MARHADETCWTVVEEAAEGDREARDRFARSYESLMRAYLTKRWGAGPLVDEVDDAIQDIFLECFKPGGTLQHAERREGGLRPLLYGVARNVARRFEERFARKRTPPAQDSAWLRALPAREATLSVAFDRAWASEILRASVLRYREACEVAGDEAKRRFRILQLRVEEELPIRAIAAELEIDDTARVHNDYRRARREFHRHLRAVVGYHGSIDVDAECERLLALFAD